MSERVPDAADSAEPAAPRRAREDGPPRKSPPADGAPPRPADGPPRQSPPADGPPERSALAEKARAARRAAADRPRTRRTAADVARAGKDAKRGETENPGEKAPEREGAEPTVARERPGGPWPMPDRSLMPTVLGVHPAAAVGVAAAFTAIGVAVDLLRIGTLGTAFTVCYLTGCVLATAWVRRGSLFWPVVAPPLLMAVAVPVVVLVAGTPRPGAGIAQRLLVIGAPLVNGFPMMAWTTGLVLALGLFRLITQRVSARPRGRAAARAGGRTSTSPRRS